MVFSLDDFYLTAADQALLAQRHSDNELLRYRGNAGTHDLRLLLDSLTALKRGASVSLPVYDKALLDGRGDRVDISGWRRVDGRFALYIPFVIDSGAVDVVVLEVTQP